MSASTLRPLGGCVARWGARGVAMLWMALSLLVQMSVAQAQSQSPAPHPPEPATLRWLNRDLATLRAPLAGAPPALRVERARARIASLTATELDAPLRALPFVLGADHGQQILLGDRLLFSLLDGDLDPELHERDLAPLVSQTLTRVEAARQAWHAGQDNALLLHGLGHTALVSGLALVLGGLLSWAVRRAAHALEARRQHLAAHSKHMQWQELLTRLGARLVHLAFWLLLGLLAYAWAQQVLSAFALTAPLAAALSGWLLDTLGWLARGLLASLPGIGTVMLVTLLARALTDALGYFFESIQRGRLSLPLLHAQTLPATKRIVTVAVWVIALAVAYPHLPGAGSEAFKGLSVLIGLMLSLGATGVVTQAMSGLVVVYARALQRGDHVELGSGDGRVEGVVTEVGPLATKLLNLRNEEITVPNAVLIATPIHNYSKLAASHGTLISTQVTIGYDTPWRQVHALLEQAAGAVPGLRTQPPPRVLQRALQDFYVQYELLVSVDKPIERLALLSQLHGQIQDAFNRAGVQIMSPNFYEQPPQPVLVPESRWHEGSTR